MIFGINIGGLSYELSKISVGFGFFDDVIVGASQGEGIRKFVSLTTKWPNSACLWYR